MSGNTNKNHIAGGCEAYFAAIGTTVPTMTGDTLDFENNEVHTITKTGTVSGGTATIELVYGGTLAGYSETTAAIAYDANADAIKAALAALNAVTAAEFTVTGGPFSTNPVIITFAGAFANTPMGLTIVDDGSITGGGSLACARTTAGRLWTQMPTPTSDVDIKPIHKIDEIRYANSPGANDGVTTDFGIDSIGWTYAETDVNAFNLTLPAANITVTPAGSGQCGMSTLTPPTTKQLDDAHVQLFVIRKGPNGAWGIATQYHDCKIDLSESEKYGVKLNERKVKFKVFCSSANSNKCYTMYQYESAATS